MRTPGQSRLAIYVSQRICHLVVEMTEWGIWMTTLWKQSEDHINVVRGG